jgi:hypothetical protein
MSDGQLGYDQQGAETTIEFLSKSFDQPPGFSHGEKHSVKHLRD